VRPSSCSRSWSITNAPAARAPSPIRKATA
jgi:hypothetical protein